MAATTSLPRPGAGEHAEYYGRYIAKVPDGDLLLTLHRQLDEVVTFFGSIGEARGDHAYAPGKWTIKEVLAHVIDAERIFAYRALRIARGDQTPLAGFDENTFAPESLASSRTLADLAEEFVLVRRSNLAMLRSFTPEVGARRGTASGHAVSVRAIAWILAGHLAHHVQILRERYLPTI